MATVMEEKLRAAGVDTATAEFQVACIEALRRHHGNGAAAAHDGRLLAALTRYLYEIARDMAGPEKPAGGQLPRDAQTSVAPAPAPNSTAERASTMLIPTDGSPDPAVEPHRDGADQKWSDAQSVCVRPVREPTVPRRGPAQLAAVSPIAVRCWYDDKVINGQKVGDATVEEALGWCDSHERDSRIIRALCANLPPAGRIRDYIDPETCSRIVAEVTAHA